MQNNDYTSDLRFFGFPKLAPYLKGYKFKFLRLAICIIVTSGLDVCIPLFNRYAINHFIGRNSLDGLLEFVLVYGGVVIFQGFATYWFFKTTSDMEISVSRDLRNQAFEHLQTLSFSYYNQNNVGYIHARVMSDTEKIGGALSWDLMDMTYNVLYILGSFVVMYVINVKLGLLVSVLIPIAAVLIIYFQKHLVHLNRRIREINSVITGDINEGITGAQTIKNLVIEDKIDDNFRRDTSEMRKVSIRATHYRALFRASIAMFSSMALALILWQGGMLTQQRLMLIGTLSVFMTYAQNVLEPIQIIIEVISFWIQAKVNIERFTGLMETESDVSDSEEVVAKYGDVFDPKRENWEELVGDIEFKDVSFKYPDGDDYVLEHFNLKVPQGTNVAIVGETGAGKSTLVNLVCRFFEPTAGEILIDGRDARERSQLWLHSNIGYVLQTPHLFSGTVRENLCYGNPLASEEEIWRAIDLVDARGVVEKMPQGLDSEVGEGGDMLSVGEKQLLSFARAILADPRILVLDEATSSIDTVTEKQIQTAISKVIKGRTTFMIAHRLSTVVDCDVILVVKDGRIIEQGTHRELMRERGYYHGLFTRQFEDKETEAAFGEV